MIYICLHVPLSIMKIIQDTITIPWFFHVLRKVSSTWDSNVKTQYRLSYQIKFEVSFQGRDTQNEVEKRIQPTRILPILNVGVEKQQQIETKFLK